MPTLPDRNPTGANLPWYRRRIVLISTVVLLVISIALGLGLGLGLTLGGDDDNDETPSPPAASPNTTTSWTLRVNVPWQIILSHPPKASTDLSHVEIIDLDLFDTPQSTIDALHRSGKKVLCYFSAGSYEEWRSDAEDFREEDMGDPLQGWEGEQWLQLGSKNVRGIMAKRIELAAEKACDGVDPDNVDGYQNDNGLDLTEQDSIDYIRYLASVTRPLNLKLGLKNAGDIIPQVLDIVDFSVNEQCVEYNECDTFQPFIDAGKPVFHIEYPAGESGLNSTVEANGFSEDVRSNICSGGRQEGSTDGFSTVLKKMNLDGWVEYCDGRVENTTVNAMIGGHDKARRSRR